MANNLTPGDDGQSLYFARSDISQLLGTFSAHPFTLEDKEWPTVEYYFQAIKFEAGSHQDKIHTQLVLRKHASWDELGSKKFATIGLPLKQCL